MKAESGSNCDQRRLVVVRVVRGRGKQETGDRRKTEQRTRARRQVIDALE